ncbi:MAG TPA: GNAT family N-acetyltransferase [Candidatus Angelobacter sp.]|nr:GNAT family N-acetyltransferase [Candidatus Angelobacter sp.]
MYELLELAVADVPRIVATNGGVAWNGGFQKWNSRLAEHLDGRRFALLAVEQTGSRCLGYGSLLWSSQYGPFREAGIPEIQDLVTSESWRNRGIATGLVAALEARARTRGCKQIGLGVGLYADYGPAQRLYTKLGYKLDGRGATYKCVPLPGGATVRLDDDLVQWMVRSL